MVSISKSCKIENCSRGGRVDSKTGKRYLARSYCYHHYRRVVGGLDPNQKTRFDHRPAIRLNNIAKIPLGLNTKDGYAIVDADYTWLDKYNWHKISTGYASASVDGKPTLMHRLILKAQANEECDHINRNILDNRLSNLRIVTSRQNKLNRGINKNNSSGYRGVVLHRKSGRWTARITVNYKVISLGYYNTPEDAAHAYNNAVKKYHDSFSELNIVQSH